MANIILVIGESGSGKSTALRTLNPKETFLIRITDKDLPFQGWKKNYVPYDKASNTGNMITSHSPTVAVKALSLAKENADIKIVVIDDLQYLMSYEFMERAKENGWQKFTDIAQNTYNVISAAKALGTDQTVIFLCHSTDEYFDGGRKTKIKTIGKMLDEKITIEGMFTIVLLSQVEKKEDGLRYWFITNNDGTTTAKSPEGMFPEKIPNDLQAVLNRIEEYNNGN